MHSTADEDERMFYINETRINGWSRNILSMQIETNLFKRQGNAVTNFNDKLPIAQSDLAQNTLKNPYLFDFLSLGKNAHEREVEKGLVAHIEKFLLELGEGFAFLGRQYHLQIEDQDFYIDLLFYHIKLRCFVVIELKSGKFKPEYAGKMNFYLSSVDDLLRSPGDNPSIGLILCRSKVGVVAEYALRDMTKPIGLAEYRLEDTLPENLQTLLPTIEELEAELAKDLGGEDE
jgi:predicted nuclease of restriction endonuclease-like (RecB) superfamily